MKDKTPAEAYRVPMLIQHYYVDRSGNVFPLCPRCGAATHADYQRYCTECGQRLKWNYAKMKPNK
jgi:ribosomal protein S27AE